MNQMGVVKQSIANVHEKNFPHTPGDGHNAERGDGESYGSVLND